MKATVPINSLNAGEISSLLDCRYDLAKVASACKTMQNAMPLVEGGAKKMPGTYYVTSTKHADKKARFVKFAFNDSQNYALEFGDQYIRCFADDGQVVGTTPGASDFYDPATAYVTNDYVVTGSYIKLDFGSSKYLYIAWPYEWSCYVIAETNTTDTLSVEWYGIDPSNPIITIKLANSTGSKNSASAIQTALRSLVDLTETVTENAAYAAARPVTVSSYGSPGLFPGASYKALQNNQYNYFPGALGAYWVAADLPTTTDIVEIASPYLEADLFDLDVSTQSADVLYIFHKDYAPKKLMRYTNTSWALVAPSFVGTIDVSKTGYGKIAKIITGITKASTAVVTCNAHGFLTGNTIYINHVLGMVELNQSTFVVTVLTANTFQLNGVVSTNYTDYDSGGWAVKLVDLFSVAGEYPACGTFYEQRLVLGGSTNYPNRINGSVQGDYENFTSDPESDDYAIQYDLVAKKAQCIRWLFGKESLMIGTSTGVVEMSGAGDAPLSQTSVQTKNPITGGVANVAPQQVNDNIVYLTRSRKIIRYLQYIYQSDQWLGPDLTRLARHITKGTTLALSGIVQTSFQAEPYPILWCVRKDGVLLGMTFESQEQVYGWFRVVTDGEVESVCSLDQDGDEDRVWIIVKRTINGSTVRYVEYFKPHEFYGEIEDAFFVHSGLTYDRTPISTVTGLTHLQGETVAILADGVVQATQVVASGQITLAAAASKIHVGLPYTMILEPLNPNAGNGQATKGRKQKINRVGLSLHESAGGELGIDQTHTYPIPYAQAEGYVAGDLLNGEVPEIDIRGEWKNEATLSIIHDEPTPFTLKCIAPTLNVNE